MRTIKIRRGDDSSKFTLTVYDAYGQIRTRHSGTYKYIYRVAQTYKKEGYKTR